MSQSTSTAVAAALLRRWNSRTWAAAAAYIVLYVLCDWLSYVQPVLKLGITPWNPQAGVTLIFLLTVGQRAAAMSAPTVFVVDDDAAVRDALSLLISLKGLRVSTFSCGEDFLAICERQWRGCLLADLQMPGMSGLELQRRRGLRGNDVAAYSAMPVSSSAPPGAS